MASTLTTPRASSPSPPRRCRGRAAGMPGAGRGMRRLRRAQRLVLGEQGQRDLVDHAAAMQEAFEGLHGTSRMSPRAWTGGSPGPSSRCAERSPTGRWCATTPTTSSPVSSRCRSRYSTTSGRGSCSPASIIATRRASTESSCTGPGRAGALARGGRGGAPGACPAGARR